jgi:predicted Zn-dependent protease
MPDIACASFSPPADVRFAAGSLGRLPCRAPRHRRQRPIDQKNWSSAGLYLAGQHAVDAGDMKTAADLLPLALQSDPNNGALAQQALIALISDGRFAPAIALAKETNKVDPKAPLASIMLAVDAIQRGKPAEAHKLLDGMGEDAVGRIAQPLIVAWLTLDEQGLDQAKAAMQPVAAVDGLKPLIESISR